ncbi:MAG: hypothetical protein JWO12_1759 [Frankiales bacterium]|nr:hypothetical protein [Frankiales bacterium]
MRSANQRYLYPVDHLRAYAATLVLLYHSTQLITVAGKGRTFNPGIDWPYSHNPIKTLVFEGHTGVSLFMVLSGFIFTLGTLGKEIQYGRFLVNRLLRIYPMYLILLFIGVSSTGVAFDLSSFAQSLFPLADFPGAAASNTIWGAMFWAVSVELQFYLVFPFLLRLLNKSGPSVLIRLIVAFLALRTLIWVAQPHLDLNRLTYFSLLGRMDQFLLGMLAAWVFTTRRHWVRAWLLPLSAAAAVAMLWGFNQAHGFAEPEGWRVAWVDVEGLVWATVIASYVAVFERRRGVVTRVLARLGEVSFSVYLLHYAVVVGVVTTANHLILGTKGTVASGFLSGLLVALPITFALAFLTYSAIEKPFLNLRVKYLRGTGRSTGLQLRVARQTPRLESAVAFYRDRLGLPEIGRFAAHDGYDGVMLDVPGTKAHLELTATDHLAPPVPHDESLLVLYVGSDAEVHRLAEGLATVPSRNPYWDTCGVTVLDPDGFRVVLVNRAWGADETPEAGHPEG